MRYLRLWWQFVITASVEQAEFRRNFALAVLGGWGGLGLAVLTFGLLYQFTNEVQGWTREEALILVGLYQLASGLWDMLVWPGITQVSDAIESGEMDFVLLRPVDSQFLVSLRRVDLPAGVQVLTGLALAAYASERAGVSWSLPAAAGAGILLLSGLVWLYAVRFLTVTLAFWLVSVGNLYVLLHSGWEAARYPVTFFRGAARALLTFVVPVAFVTTFPAQTLLGGVDGQVIAAGVAGAAAALWASHRFWAFAVRHYSSASS
jgi:ABC-2 type transport system permease protein